MDFVMGCDDTIVKTIVGAVKSVLTGGCHGRIVRTCLDVIVVRKNEGSKKAPKSLESVVREQTHTTSPVKNFRGAIFNYQYKFWQPDRLRQVESY
jgi:hypothetical protein